MPDLGKGLLDWVEIGGIGRQKPQARSCGLDYVSNDPGLMTGKIIQDDNVAGLERCDKYLFHIGAEGLPVDWAVKDTRCGQAIATQGGDEGHGVPMAMGRIWVIERSVHR